MPDFKIKYDLREFRLSKYQEKGIARVWVEFGDVVFPEKDWQDFILIVMSEWSASIINFSNSTDKEFFLRFVDGDYALKFSKKDTSFYYLSFGRWDMFSGEFEMMIEDKFIVSIKKLIKTISQVNNEVISVSSKNSVKSNYLPSLVKWANQLKKLEEKL